MLIHSSIPPSPQERSSGLADAVIGEIVGHLARLAEDADYNDAVDLRSLPMTDADRAELKQRLGEGEVKATLQLAGDTEVTETGYSGVWWVVHRGAGGVIAAEQIVVARIPDILPAHPQDVVQAVRRLQDESRAAAARDKNFSAPEPDRQGDRS